MKQELEAFVGAAIQGGVSHSDIKRLVSEEYYRQIIVFCKGNKSQAARVAGEHRNTMSRNIKLLRTANGHDHGV